MIHSCSSGGRPTPVICCRGQRRVPDVHAKAAALVHSLAATQPFNDGNKRTATLAMIAFYNLNGYLIEVEQGDLVDLAKAIANHGFETVDEIARILKGWAVPIPESYLHDAEPPPDP